MESNTPKQKIENLKETILHKIGSKEVTMRPRLYFAVRIALVVVLSIVTLLLSIFIINLVFFSLRVSSHLMLLGFGLRGVLSFLHLFPWLPLIGDIFFLVVLVKLLRKFSFGYRMPILYLLGCIFLFSLGAGLALDKETTMNDRLFIRAERNELPAPLGSLYMHARRLPAPEDGMCKCRILMIGDTMMTVVDTKAGAEKTFSIPLLPDAPTPFSEGDIIFITGDQKDGVITPRGVRPVPARQRFFFEKHL